MTGAKQCIVCLTEEEKIDLRGQKAGISLSLVKKENDDDFNFLSQNWTFSHCKELLNQISKNPSNLYLLA